MASEFITRVEHGKDEPYTVIFRTDDADKYKHIEDECRRMIGHEKPTVDAVPVVRCKDCIYYHKRHVLLDDGTEVDYDSEIVEEYLKSKRNDCLFDGYVGSDLGINVGGKCEYDKNNGYIDDKTVYRNEDDFCSKGRRFYGKEKDDADS